MLNIGAYPSLPFFPHLPLLPVAHALHFFGSPNVKHQGLIEMTKPHEYVLAILTLASLAGCNSNSERQTSESKPGTNSKGYEIVNYGSSDPKLEPTLRLGGVLETRTTDGGPVIIQSQQDQQRRAAEQQRQQKDAETKTSSDSQPK